MTREERVQAIRAAKLSLMEALDAGDFNKENAARLRLSQLEAAHALDMQLNPPSPANHKTRPFLGSD